MRWRSGLLTASSALVLAGCGGGDHAAPPPKPPRIPAAVAARLAAQADGVAALAPGTCKARDAADRFRTQVIASIQNRQIPARYQEPLLSAANSLAERLATCVAPLPPARTEPDGEHGKHKGKKKPHDGHDDGDGKGRNS
jgi:hypothetical protein